MKGFPFKSAGLVVGYAKPRYGLVTVEEPQYARPATDDPGYEIAVVEEPQYEFATVAKPALLGPTVESARDARLLRARRPDACFILMPLAEPDRSRKALALVCEHFSSRVSPPSEAHQRDVAIALLAQCWQEQVGQRRGPRATPIEDGQRLVNALASQWNAFVNPPHVPGNASQAGRAAGGILDRFEAGLRR